MQQFLPHQALPTFLKELFGWRNCRWQAVSHELSFECPYSPAASIHASCSKEGTDFLFIYLFFFTIFIHKSATMDHNTTCDNALFTL